jgi:cytochrome c oxidase subunit 4
MSASSNPHGHEPGQPGARAIAEVDPSTLGEEVVEGHGHPSDRFYVAIAIILAVFTAMEVSASYMDLGAAFLPILLVLMAAKFIMVVLFFMHLRFDNKIFGRLFWSGLILAVAVYLVALATFHVFSSSA